MPVRFQVDADFYDHPKTIGMSSDAYKLWVRAGSFSAAKLLDGFIADDVITETLRADRAVADELVRRRLWRRVRGGYQFHQYEDRNLTRTRVEGDRERDRKRKRAERDDTTSTSREGNEDPTKGNRATIGDPSENRQTRNGKPVDNSSRETEPQHTDGSVQMESERNPNGIPSESGRNPDGSVSVSVSVSESESVSGSGQAASGSPQEPPARCPDHQDDPHPPPCGRCADARRDHERWQAGYDQWRLGEHERRRNAPQCRTHRGQPAHNCGPCRAEALAAS